MFQDLFSCENQDNEYLQEDEKSFDIQCSITHCFFHKQRTEKENLQLPAWDND